MMTCSFREDAERPKIIRENMSGWLRYHVYHMAENCVDAHCSISRCRHWQHEMVSELGVTAAGARVMTLSKVVDI